MQNYTFKLVPLGGINKNTLNKMYNVNSNSLALSGQIKEDNNFNKLFY